MESGIAYFDGLAYEGWHIIGFPVRVLARWLPALDLCQFLADGAGDCTGDDALKLRTHSGWKHCGEMFNNRFGPLFRRHPADSTWLKHCTGKNKDGRQDPSTWRFVMNHAQPGWSVRRHRKANLAERCQKRPINIEVMEKEDTPNVPTK